MAFAANSVLCRVALGGHSIDAATFVLVRLASGAAVLLALNARSVRSIRLARDWQPAGMLFWYAIAFSFAYRSLGTGTGALILFGCVQSTMLVAAMHAGERLRGLESLGLLLAIGGLAWLVSPGLTAPAPIGSLLMASAGVAWGLYSLRGRGTRDPIGDTTRNFVLATVPAIAVGMLASLALRNVHVSTLGLSLAVVSGALSSGLGYVVWFAALRGLTGVRAALVQLVVPMLAATGGVVFLSERLSLRLVLSAALILGGVGLALAQHARSAARPGEA